MNYRWFPAIAALAISVPICAQARAGEPLEAYSDQIGLVTQIDWSLRQAASSQCAELVYDIGWQLDHPRLYTSPAIATDAPIVSALVAGGPAHDAGVQEGDVVLGLAGTPVSVSLGGLEAETLAEALLYLSASTTLQPVSLELRRAGQVVHVEVIPTQLCAFQTVLVEDRNASAWSDEAKLAVTTGLVRQASNTDELALVMAHEMAHIIIRQFPDKFDVRGKRKEYLADHIGAQIMHCAGYDLARGAQFWLNRPKRGLLSGLGTFSHPGAGKRYERLMDFAARASCDGGKS